MGVGAKGKGDTTIRCPLRIGSHDSTKLLRDFSYRGFVLVLAVFGHPERTLSSTLVKSFAEQ